MLFGDRNLISGDFGSNDGIEGHGNRYEDGRKQTCPPVPLARSRRARKWGMGVRHALFPMLTLGALPRGRLPASRRYSPRQAEFPAS